MIIPESSILFWGKSLQSHRVLLKDNFYLIIYWGDKTRPNILVKGGNVVDEHRNFLKIHMESPIGYIQVDEGKYQWWTKNKTTTVVDTTGRKIFKNEEGLLEEETFNEIEFNKLEREYAKLLKEKKSKTTRGLVKLIIGALIAFFLWKKI